MRASSILKSHNMALLSLGSLSLYAILSTSSFALQPVTATSQQQDESQTAQVIFTNPNPIVINDATTASPYPSSINVSGLTGNIPATPGSVKVTLCNFSHTFPDDVGIVLVGPTNAALLIQNGAGETADMVNVTYTLSDTGATALPDATAWINGIYKPTSYYTGDNFPAPGPGTTYVNPGPAGGVMGNFSSTFGGTNPNGTWSLYVVDFVTNKAGSIGCGWSLEINSSTTAGSRRTVYDFTGDIRTDFVTLSAASATAPLRWKVSRNPAGSAPFIRIFDYGFGGDSIVPADRAGSAKFEPCVWRTGTYFCINFPESSLVSLPVVNWGQAGDAVARDGDYDGNGKDDYVVIRTIGGIFNWFYKSAENSPAGDRNVQFGNTTTAGQSLFRFQGADFTGDAREEIIIARVDSATLNVTWQIGDSLTGAVLNTVHWGNFNTDFIIQPDDYTGDGIADLVVWRAGADGSWWIRNTATGATVPPVFFGIPDPGFEVNDLACRGDYDGDNIADRAVFRPTTREFFWVPSSLPSATGGQQWGEANDTALATFFTF